MDSDLIRAIMFFAGVGVSAHHIAAAAALKRAPHMVKGFSMPITVASGVGMIFMAVTGDTQAGLKCALGMVVGMGVTELMVWRAGAYISDRLDQQAEIHEMARRQVNLMKNDLWGSWEIFDGLQEPQPERHLEKNSNRD